MVVVVDDDAAMCEALQNLIRSVGLKVEAFGSIADFLVRMDSYNTSCLVLDVRPPGRNGLDFHDELRRAKRRAAAALQATYATLTSRERDVFELGVSEVTVKGPQEPGHAQDECQNVGGVGSNERCAPGRTIRMFYVS
jgi:FixJ family two-component response regulator